MRATAAPTLTSLYSFSDLNNNADGGQPDAALVQGRGGSFYGTTFSGGVGENGTIFKLSSTGALTTLHSFSALDEYGTNNDGANPDAALIRGSDGSFYGTTEDGGPLGDGTVFKSRRREC